MSERTDLMIGTVNVLQRMVVLLQQTCQRRETSGAASSSVAPIPVAPRVARAPVCKARNEFQRLVEKMNEQQRGTS
jgi:hypothetical protein